MQIAENQTQNLFRIINNLNKECDHNVAGATEGSVCACVYIKKLIEQDRSTTNGTT